MDIIIVSVGRYIWRWGDSGLGRDISNLIRGPIHKQSKACAQRTFPHGSKGNMQGILYT
jgi:hypothetical protein